MNSELFSVNDKVVIITGASRGIGHTLAAGFLEHGARVTMVARSAEPLQQLAAAFPATALDIACDIGQADASTRICDDALERFETIDTLINCAGVSGGGDDPYSDAVWDRTMAVNLRAAFRISRAVCEIMSERGGGSIINIASIGALLGFPNNPSYQASKAGLRHLTKALARDWGPHGIRVNTVCPGYFPTEMTQATYSQPELHAERSTRSMLGRWGDCRELLGPCLFLASEASSFVTASDVVVDGGWSARGL